MLSDLTLLHAWDADVGVLAGGLAGKLLLVQPRMGPGATSRSTASRSSMGMP